MESERESVYFGLELVRHEDGRTEWIDTPEGAPRWVGDERAQEAAERWASLPESYWFARLVQEVGELGSSLVGDHDDPPEHELEQIRTIAANWLELRRVKALAAPREEDTTP